MNKILITYSYDITNEELDKLDKEARTLGYRDLNDMMQQLCAEDFHQFIHSRADETVFADWDE